MLKRIMESIVEMLVLLAVISLCVGYICEFIASVDVQPRESYTNSNDATIPESNENIENKTVYLDIEQDDFMSPERKSRIGVELFYDIAPKTAENFYQLCVNKKYQGVPFHRVINGFMIQGGDITNHDGTGGVSIYGETFNDENFELNHDQEGLLSMANSGPNTNSSQFFILLGPAPHLDGKHVIFGRVISGMGSVRNIGTTPVDFNDAPLNPITITKSGPLKIED
tara:strand:+ start:859 stop:1536 length:678 start_codon:yes stop_codon:yes gene_type:complete